MASNVTAFPRVSRPQRQYWDTEELLLSYGRNQNCEIRVYRVFKKSFSAIEVRVRWKDRDTQQWKNEVGGLALTMAEWRTLSKRLDELA